jgi:hypothetical protein
MDEKRLKYPRTLHFPWTGHMTTDDKKWSYEQVCEQFVGKEVVTSVKLDGECTTMRPDIVHARSPESRNHPSRTVIKSLHARIKHEIPRGWRICGENVYAEHSIHYHELTSYFYVFTIFNEFGIGIEWDSTLQICEMLGLQTVPVLSRAKWDEEKVKQLMSTPPVFGGKDIITGLPALEGYVARITGEILVGKVEDADENSRDILLGVGKCVRRGHVQTSEHWLEKPMIVNNLAEGIVL